MSTSLHFLRAYLQVRILLRVSGLKSVIHRLGRMPVCDLSPAEQQVKAKHLVNSFLRIRPWVYTAHGRCLFDALVLTEYLRRQNIPAHFLIGTFPAPFSAHAWVQLADHLIDDTVESIGLYTPILVA